MMKQIALSSLAICLWIAATDYAQSTQPVAATAGQPLLKSVPPPLPGALTDNAPRGTEPLPPVIPLLPEGTHINRHTGKLSHSTDGQQAIFTFDVDDKGVQYSPMTVMPNLKLLMLEGAVTQQNNDFPISGTVTEYKGRNYILLDNVPRGTIPERRAVNLVREGTYITTRSCRLDHNATNQPILTFDADGKTQQDPPMIILPNQKLQAVEAAVVNLTKDAHFRVSGSVMEYKGKNYILLDKAVVAADVDQQM